MRILVNALSLGWLSGKHVLFGHLRQLAQHNSAEHEFVLLHRRDTGLQELSDLPNVVIVPHIASATSWTREGMATLAASNVAGILNGYPVWPDPNNILPFLGDNPPKAAPSIVNAKELGLPVATA